MSTASSNRVGLVLALAGVWSGCVLDTSLKDRCDLDSDCASGRLCRDHRCRNRAAPDAQEADSSPDVAAPDAQLETGLPEVAVPDAQVEAGSPDRDARDAGPAEAPGAPNADAGDGAMEAAPLGSDHPNYAFVTSMKFSPKLQSLGAADDDCGFLAAHQGLPGVFRAWLSASWIDARDRMGAARGWIRPDGLPVADTIDDLAQGHFWYPLALDESGTKILLTDENADPVITGSTDFGLLAPDNCQDWTGSSGPFAGAGNVNATGRDWEASGDADCTVPSRFFCFGVDQAVPVSVPKPPTGARVAFISEKKLALSGGVATADFLCQIEASAAGLPGNFHALLATSTASLNQRVPTTPNDVWIRPDGVVLNPGAGTRLYDGVIAASIDITARGNVVNDDEYVLIGAADPDTPPTAEKTCLDWTLPNASMPFGASSGLVHRPDWWLNVGYPVACGFLRHVYCLQDAQP
jgi:hypothetical protein